MSVTILSKVQLPPYSCERFFMLSEIEVHSQPIAFLPGIGEDQNNEDNSTQATDEETTTAETTNDDEGTPAEEEEDGTGKETDAALHAPFLILYLLWGPNEAADPGAFLELSILPSIARLNGVVDLEQSSLRPHLDAATAAGGTPATTKNNTSRSTPRSGVRRCASLNDGDTNKGDDSKEPLLPETKGRNPTEPSDDEAVAEATRRRQPKASVYIVVDKVLHNSTVAGDEDDPASSSQHRQEEATWQLEQEALAEQLARLVASTAFLRDCTEGITVGVSNHQRAAPGLEGTNSTDFV
jgi:hypothetical protein